MFFQEFNESPLCENTWYSILVRTGVFREGTKPRFMPMATVDNVLEAVKHGMQREVAQAAKSRIIDGGGVVPEENRLQDAIIPDD